MNPYKQLLEFSRIADDKLNNEPETDDHIQAIINFWTNYASSNIHLLSCNDCTEFVESKVTKSDWNSLTSETFHPESYRKSKEDRSFFIRQRFKIAVIRIIKALKGPLKADADPYNRILFTVETAKNEPKATQKSELTPKELRQLFKSAIDYVLIQCKVQKLTGDPYQRFFYIAIAALRRKKRHSQRKFSRQNLGVSTNSQCPSPILQLPPHISTPDQMARTSVDMSSVGSDAGSYDVQITVKESLSLPKLSSGFESDADDSINKVREKKTRFTLQNRVGGYDTIEIIHTKHRPVHRDDLQAVLERLCRPLNRDIRSKVVKQLLKADRRHRPRKVVRPSQEVDRIVQRLYSRESLATLLHGNKMQSTQIQWILPMTYGGMKSCGNSLPGMNTFTNDVLKASRLLTGFRES